tara:strand:+ start:711 stop:1259 length:549 start_codon:yes stop_codon:yes gene_type:complete
MTNIESHKSVAIELPTFRVLKAVADKEFRTPSKQIAFLIASQYPEVWEEHVQIEIGITAPSLDGSIVPFSHDKVPDDTRSQYRTWQVLVCLYKNRSLGSLRTPQLATAIGYTHENSLSSALMRPRDVGLITSRSISVTARELEWSLTDFGRFVAKDLDDNIPIRLTQAILDRYQRQFVRVTS